MSTAKRFFVSAEELGEVLDLSGAGVRSLVKRSGLDFTRGRREQMSFTRLQIIAVLEHRGVPNLDAVDIASELTGMGRARNTAPREKQSAASALRTEAVATSPVTDPYPSALEIVDAYEAEIDPFRTTARSRAAHRKSA